MKTDFKNTIFSFFNRNGNGNVTLPPTKVLLDIDKKFSEKHFNIYAF